MEKRQSALQDRLQQALLPWTPNSDGEVPPDQPQDVVIEIDSNDYISMPFQLQLNENHSLQIRAANHTRPILWIPDQSPAAPDAFSATLAPGSRLILDGLLITNRSVYITTENGANPVDEICPAELIIRHCTLVPGWGLDSDCNPRAPGEDPAPGIGQSRRKSTHRAQHRRGDPGRVG